MQPRKGGHFYFKANMKYNIQIDNFTSHRWGLSIQEAYIFSWLFCVPSWGQRVSLDYEDYYFASRTKAIEEIPLVTDKLDTMYRYYKALDSKGLIKLKKIEGKDFISITKKGQEWNSLIRASENNPTILGKKSESNSENNPTYNNTILDNNNNHNKHLMCEVDTSHDTSDSFQIAYAYFKLFEKNSNQLNVTWSHLKKTKVKDCVLPVRLLIDVDKRTKEELITVFRFLEKDPFWMKNIQTTKKLREKFDQLITQAKNPKTNERDKSENRVQYFIANDPNWKNK
jgi:hypothetical protein